jgi:hypothetical protein
VNSVLLWASIVGRGTFGLMLGFWCSRGPGRRKHLGSADPSGLLRGSEAPKPGDEA